MIFYIRYQLFRICLRKHGENTNNPSIKIHVNKIKTEPHLKLKRDIIANF